MFVSNANWLLFIIVLNQRRISSGLIIQHIIDQHLLKKLSNVNRIVWRTPIYLFLQTVDHHRRQFQPAISHCALSQVFNIATLDREALQIVKRGRISKTSYLEDGWIALAR